jgi:hypothetical protein
MRKEFAKIVSLLLQIREEMVFKNALKLNLCLKLSLALCMSFACMGHMQKDMQHFEYFLTLNK